MKITIKYFAGLRDITGKELEKVDLPEKMKIADLISMLYEKYPEMKKSADIVVARNRQYAEEDEEIEEGDEIALLPPVSGG